MSNTNAKYFLIQDKLLAKLLNWWEKISIGILDSNWICVARNFKLGSLWINENTLSLLQACFLPGTLALAHHHGLSLTATLPPKDPNQHSHPSNNVLMEVRKFFNDVTCQWEFCRKSPGSPHTYSKMTGTFYKYPFWVVLQICYSLQSILYNKDFVLFSAFFPFSLPKNWPTLVTWLLLASQRIWHRKSHILTQIHHRLPIFTLNQPIHITCWDQRQLKAYGICTMLLVTKPTKIGDGIYSK